MLFIILFNKCLSQNIVNENSPISFISPLIHGNLKVEDTLSSYKNFFSISNNLGSFQSNNILANNFNLQNKYGIGYISLFNNNYLYYNTINNENNTDTSISIGKKNLINNRKISIEIDNDYLRLKNFLNSNSYIFYIQKYDTMYIKTQYLKNSNLETSNFKIYKNYIGFQEFSKNNLNLGYDELDNNYLGINTVNNLSNFRNNIIIGTNSTFTAHYFFGGRYNILLGYNNTSNNIKNKNILIGTNNIGGDNSDNILIGNDNIFSYNPYNNILLGNNNLAIFNNNINIGNNITNLATNSIVIGRDIYSGYGNNKIIISNSYTLQANADNFISIGDSNGVYSHNIIVLGKKNISGSYCNYSSFIGQNNYISSGSFNSILGYNNSVNDDIYNVKIIGDSNYVYTGTNNSIILGYKFYGYADNSFIVNFKNGLLIDGRVDNNNQFNKINLNGSVGTLGEKKHIKYINNNYNVQYDDNYLVIDCSNNNVILKLPNLSYLDNGKMYCIKKIDNTNNNVIIETYFTNQKIDDYINTYNISIKNDYVRILYLNNDWYIF